MDRFFVETWKKALRLVSIPEEKMPDINKIIAAMVETYEGNTIPAGIKDYWLMVGWHGNLVNHVYNEWQPKKGDIVIASFPKTGATWTRELVRRMVYRNDEELLEATYFAIPIFAYLCMLPEEKFQIVDNLPMDRRVLGTHLPAPLFNFEKFRKKGAKIIYVIRNPKDQAVSMYNFITQFPYIDKEPFMEMFSSNEKKFYDLLIAGKQKVFAKEGEGYLEHVRGWYEHKNDANVMFLCYEDMKADYYGQLRKIGDFIGENLTDEEINVVTQMTSLSKMKEEETKTNSPIHVIKKGQVGGWKDHLTVAQSELIDSKVESILGDTDIKFRYEL